MPSAPTPLPPARPRRRPGAWLAVALSACLVTGLAACSDDGSDGAAASSTTVATSADPGATSTTEAGSTTTETDSSTTAPSTSTTAPATTSTTSVTDTTAPGGETTSGLGSLPEGTHYGYFTGVSDGQVEGQQVQVVSFDKVELLTGEAAQQAAADHGETVENDYYIVNDKKTLRLLPVIPDSQVSVLQGGTPTLVAGSVDEAVNQPNLYKVEIVVVRGVSLITSIEGVFLP